MKFTFIDAAKAEFPIQRLCQVFEVSQSGYFAWRDRPASPRQREDLVLLAHIRSAFTLSNETYGSPRMTRELQDDGLMVGRRRTARLMRENGLKARQKRRFRRTTDSYHAFPIAPNLLEQDFSATRPNQKWNADISRTCGRGKAGCIWPWSSISSLGGWLAGRLATGCTRSWRSRRSARLCRSEDVVRG
jgi:putative transposase